MEWWSGGRTEDGIAAADKIRIGKSQREKLMILQELRKEGDGHRRLGIYDPKAHGSIRCRHNQGANNRPIK